MVRRSIEVAMFAAVLLGVAATGAAAQSGASQGQTPVLTTPEFITGAKQFDEYAGQAGRLAQSQGSNSEVRAYGAKMIKDHGIADAELDSAMQQSGMTPVPPVRLNADQRDMLGRLQGLQGMAFDAEYARQAALSGQYELGLYEEYDLKGDNPAIQQLSKRTTPILKQHVRLAENMCCS